MNNLYGFGMIQPMSISDINFLTKIDLDFISENSSIYFRS